MKPLTALLIWFIPASILIADTDTLYQDGSRYRVQIVREFNVSPGGRLSIEEIAGDVDITGISEARVVVKEKISIYTHSKSDARRLKEEYQADYGKTGNTVEIHGPGKSSRKVQVYFQIEVPEIFSVLVGTSGGDIETVNITGDIRIYTSGGDMDLQNVAGKVQAETSGGDISIRDAQGTLQMETSGGDIEIENIEGTVKVKTSGGDIDIVNVNGSADFNTSGGDITLQDLRGEYFEAKTSGGFIRADNILANLDLYTSGGDITIEDILGNLNASTSGGDIDLNNVNGNVDVHTSGGDIQAMEVLGFLEASTSGGDITSSKRFTGDFDDNHIYLQTSGGEIILYITENARASIDAKIRTSRSRFDYYDVHSEFPLTIERDYESREEINAKGDINGGGDLIKLRTSNGDIQIKHIR